MNEGCSCYSARCYTTPKRPKQLSAVALAGSPLKICISVNIFFYLFFFPLHQMDSPLTGSLTSSLTSLPEREEMRGGRREGAQVREGGHSPLSHLLEVMCSCEL